MRQRARFGSGLVPTGGRAVLVAALTLGFPLLAAGEVEITHGGVDCVVAGQFPVIQAALVPPGEVARARVFFHGRGAASWYYVEMKSKGGATFEGVLPQPLATLDGIEYYIETLASGFDQRRSREFSADVITGSEACPAGRTKATMVSSVPSAIVVGAPEGASAVPPGFARIGLASAGGGVSTGVLVGVGAAAAAGGIAVVATSGGDGGSSTPGSSPPPTGGGTPQPPPTPTPTPTPMRDVTGSWAGTFNENPSATRCTVETDLSLQLQQTGTAVSGTFQLLIRTANSVPADPCPVKPGDVLNGPVSGVVNGDAISIELGIPGGGPTLTLHGTVADDHMGGTDPGGGGSWDVGRQ
jgi:hypothetical protein